MNKSMGHSELEITAIKLTINGDQRDAFRIRTATHSIEAIELDMAEQWDFLELAGRQIDNEAWVNVAVLAAAVVSVDGVPVPGGAKTKETLRQVLKKIGEEGLAALQVAFADNTDADDQGASAESAAGN